MTNHDHITHQHGDDSEGRDPVRCLRRGRWVFIAFAAIAAVYLLSEHRAHVLGALPFLLLAACPLMHIFMHGGHGGHGGHGHDGHGDPSTPNKDGKDWT